MKDSWDEVFQSLLGLFFLLCFHLVQGSGFKVQG